MSRAPQPKQRLAVRETVHVDLPREEAFLLFTDGINQWWPLDEGYSFGGDRAREIFLEPFEGGRFYERFVDGDELQVGTVRVCTPPDRILFTWRSPDWQADTEVDVRFLDEENGTTLHLEHRGFEQLGSDGEASAARYAGGWPRVIESFVTRASRQ